jgi:GT2 family glycosyltransferase
MGTNTALIVLNYNDYANTSKYIQAIKDYEIIKKIVIVDNNSNDNNIDKLKLLASDKIDVISSNKNGGYAYGNNFGLKYLDNTYGEKYFDYVIISNPDISVEEQTIKECIDELEESTDIAVVAPRMYFVNGPARRSAWKKRNFLRDVANSTRITELLMYPIFKSGEYSKKNFEKNKLEVEAIAGSFFVARHEYFRDVGYFDENTFLFFEEDMLSMKLKDKGYKILSLNNLKFIHYDSQTIGKIMNTFKKQDIMFDSRKYFHKEYNKVSFFGIALIEFLRYIRKIELCIEIPIRKISQQKK